MPPRTLADGQFFGRRRRHHEAAGFLISESRYAASERLPDHAHRRAHLCFVVSGRYTEQTADGEAGRRPGDLLFYPPGADHAETHHEPGRHLLVELAEPLLDRLRPLPGGRAPLETRGGRARWTAGRLLGEVGRREEAAALALEGLVLQLLAEVARARADQERPPWVDAARRLLRRRIASPPDTAELARRLGLSSRRLESGLRQWEDTTVAALIRQLRVEAAAERLSSGDESLADVAQAVGYCDQSHFTRAFRRATGSTPGAYRRAFGRS